MFLNVEQLEKQLNREDFQEIGSMAAFNVLETQFQMFITSRMNERKMQTIEEKVDTSKAIDASSVDIESSRIESKEQDTSSSSVNDAHDNDADIRPIYDEELMDKVKTTTEINVFAIGQQHTEQPEFNNEGEVVQNAKECHHTCPMPDILTDNQITEHSYQSLESENICLKKTVAQFQNDFSRLEAHCVILELKYQNHVLNEGQQSQFLKDKSNEAKVKLDIDVIETINIELEHKVAKLLKENETLKKHYKELFDSIKITKAKTIEHTTYLIATNDKFIAQLQEKGFAITTLKMITTHYLPKEREDASTKPHHMIASSNSRISSKNIPRFSSNDMVHNHYLEEAKKKTQEHSRNSEPSSMPFARSKSTANGSKPMPRRNTQTFRNWPESKNSFVMTKTKCVFSANHDSCVIKFLKEVNSRAKVPSNKTPKRNKPVEQISVPNKQERQIPTSHRFSIQQTFVMQKKTMTHRSCLRWKPTGKIFKIVGLRWVPTGKIFASSTTKVDSEPLNGSNIDITNQYECEQTLGVSAGTLNLSAVPSTPTYVHAEENNNDQAEEEHLADDKFTNPFCAPAQEVAESFSHNIDGRVNDISKWSTNGGGLCCTTRRVVDPDHPEKAKYDLEILHKHGMNKGQKIGTPMATKPKLDADLSGNSGSLFGLTAFLDAAGHAGCIDSRKSTSGGIQFLGDKLVSWMSKKQNCTTMSSVKDEYVALSASCAQVITEYQLADMFTKALPEDRFKYLVRRIGMRCLTPAELEVLVTPPNWPAAEYWVRGVLLHGSTTQDIY
uniref:Gag-Pol polyprotein n=1 Tax=Tanacetum cinerariifolium TaxID=118510 RepID=A0A699IAS9_TANCI|nr:Gag-Pol polyprotein [Tanacetum cinerariifolium]